MSVDYPACKVSIIIPSRLAVNPISTQQNLYLDLCLGGIIRQTADVEKEIIVGIDKGARHLIPERFLEPANPPIRFVESKGTGQAAAVNAAAAKATGDVLAFCEDDDLWEPSKLEFQLPLLERFDLVTCNQRERATDGSFVRYNSFCTPSGWLLPTETWRGLTQFEAKPPGMLARVFGAVPLHGLDESFRWHVDTEWLGRANAAGLRRVHLIHDGFPGDAWLREVGKRSAIMKTDGFSTPLVHRMINPSGGMSTIERDPEARMQSVREHEVMTKRFGGQAPW